MAISNNTIEQINYVKDIDFEYNIKLLLIIFFVAIALFLIWYSNKRLDRTTERGDITYYIINVFSFSVIVFSPMYYFILLRTVSLYIVLEWLFIFYGIMIAILTLYIIYFFGEKFLVKYFGVNFSYRKTKLRTSEDYRKYD